ncbi:MAG: MBL fold metallo-hydrolase [Deltaproteobacteria bacterium]|nr:MBL fold metallo-hydrolase [Deltaproteobacteria bacterium]
MDALRVALEVKPNPSAIGDFLDNLPDRLVSTIGGNTPCLEVRQGDDTLIIDAGTGINALGRQLTNDDYDPDAERLRYLIETQYHDLPVSPYPDETEKILNLNLLFTHTHWDHIQGFPFFTPIYRPGTTLDIYGANGQQIKEALSLQQSTTSLFPVLLENVPAKISFHDFPPEGLKIGPFEIESLALPHPGGSLAFKIKSQGKTLVFATDYEFAGSEAGADSTELKLSRFIDLADVFISDTQYTYLESMTKEGWGHSSPLKVAEMALHAGVKQFFLFHYDPFYSDRKLFEMLERTLSYTNLLSSAHSMAINLAIEGREIVV